MKRLVAGVAVLLLLSPHAGARADSKGEPGPQQTARPFYGTKPPHQPPGRPTPAPPVQPTPLPTAPPPAPHPPSARSSSPVRQVVLFTGTRNMTATNVVHLNQRVLIVVRLKRSKNVTHARGTLRVSRGSKIVLRESLKSGIWVDGKPILYRVLRFRNRKFAGYLVARVSLSVGRSHSVTTLGFWLRPAGALLALPVPGLGG